MQIKSIQLVPSPPPHAIITQPSVGVTRLQGGVIALNSAVPTSTFSAVRIAWRWCDQLKSSCFPRLTGSTAASCDTIWRLVRHKLFAGGGPTKAQIEGGARLCMPLPPYGMQQKAARKNHNLPTFYIISCFRIKQERDY